MNRLKVHGVLAALALAAMPLVSGAQLLKGTTEGNTGPIQVVLTADGDLLAAEYVEVEVGEDGTFTFDRELGKPYEDVSIYVGDMDICGAHLENGKTLEVVIRRGKDGKAGYSFKGEHARLSEFYTAYVQAFDLMRYLPMNPEDAKPYEENRQILAVEYERVKGMLKGIRDKKLREHYAALVESGNKNITVRLMEEEANKQGKPAMEFPGYKEVMASVDINDEANVATGLMFSKMKSLIDTALVAEGGMSAEYYLAFMKVVEEQATNPGGRKARTVDCGYMYFAYGDKTGVKAFWEAYQAFAKDYPEFIAAYQPQVAALEKTAVGTPAPDARLTAPDGTECRLSDLFGKFLYIDVWATWCGPCCAEIPNLEKVAAHFKGNDKVQVVSISIDANRKAWLAKLEKDQPEWAQYILTPEEAAAFQRAWGINGIPRFLMIDKEGKIFNADAPRPSSEGIIETIEEQLK